MSDEMNGDAVVFNDLRDQGERRAERDWSLLALLGIVPTQPPPDPDGPPDFDGGAREPANEDPDPEQITTRPSLRSSSASDRRTTEGRSYELAKATEEPSTPTARRLRGPP
jgi:hypothetical protein